MRWVVSMQLSWGDYVLGVEDFEASDRPIRAGIDTSTLVRFLAGVPWLSDPSSKAPSWRRLLAGEHHQLHVGDLEVRIWASTRRANRWPTSSWGLACLAALITSPLAAAPRAPAVTVAMPAAAPTLDRGFDHLPHPAPSYLVRWTAEPQSQLISLAGTTRCGQATLGEPQLRPTDGRYSVAGPSDNPDPHLERWPIGGDEPMPGPLDSAQPIRPHTRVGQSAAPSAPWGRDSSEGSDQRDDVGALWGDALDSNQGELGLGKAGSPGGIAKGVELRAGGPAVGRRIVQAGLVVRGALPVSAIGRALQPRFVGVRACVERVAESDSDTTIGIRLRVEPEGSVRLTWLEAAGVSDPELGRCLAEQLESVRLPVADGVTIVDYPLVALRDSTEPSATPIAPQRSALPTSPCATSEPCPTDP
ncbi:MAG TPA: hypothetical protein VLC09_12010 [Polyangiaceae bacterium]|nr:hypothetical protein [Polyangiaceae bacterium]